jgi:hypothetical protein
MQVHAVASDAKVQQYNNTIEDNRVVTALCYAQDGLAWPFIYIYLVVSGERSEMQIPVSRKGTLS